MELEEVKLKAEIAKTAAREMILAEVESKPPKTIEHVSKGKLS